MSKAPLTEKQQKVYSFLVSQMSSGFPPTVREICAATGIKSTSTVHAILNVLEEESYIVRDAKFSRAIRLETDTDSSMVPLVGKNQQQADPMCRQQRYTLPKNPPAQQAGQQYDQR